MISVDRKELYTGCRIGENVIIEDDVFIGDGVTLHNDVILRAGCEIGDGAVIGYREKEGIDAPTVIGRNAKIRSGATIYYGCSIGEGSSVGHNSVLRDGIWVGDNTYIGALVMMEGETVVGNNVAINAQCHITRHVTIEDYVFFGPGVMSMNDNGIAYKRPGHGVGMLGFTAKYAARIAGGAILLPKVILGQGCFVGAGSLVTKDVPSYAMVYGSPARFVKLVDTRDQEVVK